MNLTNIKKIKFTKIPEKINTVNNKKIKSKNKINKNKIKTNNKNRKKLKQKKFLVKKINYDQTKIEIIKKFEEEQENKVTEIQEIKIKNSDIVNEDLVIEKIGFGWKGLGKRRIVYDDKI